MYGLGYYNSFDTKDCRRIKLFDIYQIVIWSILLLFIASKIRQKHWKIIFSKIAALLITLEIVSIYLTDRFIDYRFYNHLNLNAIEGHGFQFITHFILFAILLILIGFLLYFGSKKIDQLSINNNRFFVPIVLVSFILLSWPSGILNELYKIYEILDAEEKSFNDALTDLGISPDKYITPDQIKAIQGKNIIIISIESLEQGFLSSNFNNIAPNLRKLSKEWTYYNKMPSAPGGGWTAASLYNHQVGMPAFFKGQGNDFFQGITDVKLTGLGHILKTAGYNSRYVVGNKEFAGMSDLLAAYKIQVISEKNSIGKYPKSSSGLYDFDLFQEAKLQIQTLIKDTNKPFALFLSTIDTHFPHGFYDKRMEKFIPKRDSNLEFSVSAVDYLINDFIGYLKKENLYDNTAIFIFPDHLLMGKSGDEIEKLKTSKRQLYLITNISEKDLPKKTSDNIYQIDLPRMIVNGAGINTNAKFLSDFIHTGNTVDFITKNLIKITTLNTSSVTKADYKNGISIKIIDNNLFISSDMETISFTLNKKAKSEGFDITFNPKMVVISYKKRNFNNSFSMDEYDEQHKRLHLIVNIKDGNIDKTYFGNKKYIGFFKVGEQISYAKEDVDLITESNNAMLYTKPKIKPEKIQFINDYPPLVSITSSEYITSKTIKSTLKVNGKSFHLTRGLNLLTTNIKGKFQIEHYDTYGSEKAANQFLGRIQDLVKRKQFWAIASHDAVKNTYSNFRVKLKDLGFKKLQTLNGRMAYISYSDSAQQIKEYSSKTSLSYIIPSYLTYLPEDEKNILKKQQIENNSIANIYRKDPKRFIAHAGGAIDGHKYTNSLEAMNLSYKNGFRLFELDIIKTSDNVYVAAHDWKHWSGQTGYKGKVPPTRKEFLEQKILKKYTPMDMDAINTWFIKHPDAILVTDKINTPIDFSNKFIDKNRLMMELFSLKAVKEGIESKIKSSMPSDNVLNKIQGDKVAFLKKLGVTDIASSRRIINNNLGLVKNIVDSGINIYAFHLHFDEGKDEAYVVCNENQYFYGMYADKWNFNEFLDCSKH